MRAFRLAPVALCVVCGCTTVKPGTLPSRPEPDAQVLALPADNPIRLVSAQQKRDSESASQDPVPLILQERIPEVGQDGVTEEAESQAQVPAPQDTVPLDPIPGEPKVPSPNGSLTLEAVINSVHDSFPLVEAAYREREIASGRILAAEGGFDTKVKASSENGPTGFYQTYRQKAGVSQPLFSGGEVFGGYRVGRGDFEPWYQERQTNDGGELKVGASIPLWRNRDIDARRAELWRADYDAQIAQPSIRAQLITFTFDASLAYWKWVAEGRKYHAERAWLNLAAQRIDQIKRLVQEGELDPPEEKDNNRAIAKRRAKVADQLRKVQQAAVKLSLFLRDASGQPIVPTLEQLPDFPTAEPIDDSRFTEDTQLALQQRPDLQILRLLQERLDIDYQEACNLGLPRLDAMLMAGQDFGAPTSPKRDKSEFEVDAGLYFDVPVQRRKALGKMRSIEAKIAQVVAKERFTIDKINAGLRAAFAGMTQAHAQLIEARRARTLANEMAAIERRKLELGESDLLKVALREQYALEAVEGEVDALLNYFSARSQYTAEMGSDR